MQDDSDDGRGNHPAAYRNDAPNPNMAQFEFPSDDDDDDRWFKKAHPIFDRLGRPKMPSEYRWNSDHELGDLTDDDRSYRDYMGRAFHSAGITAKQAAMLEKAQIEHLRTYRDAQSAKGRDATKKARDELTKEWGQAAANRIAKANSLLHDYGGRDAKALSGLMLSDGTPLASHAAFVRLLANVAEATPTKAGSTSNAKEQIEKLQAELTRKGIDPTSPRWPHDEFDKLYRKALGSEAIDQSYGGGPR